LNHGQRPQISLVRSIEYGSKLYLRGQVFTTPPHGRHCKTNSNVARDYFTFVMMNIPLVNLGLVDDLTSHNFLLRSVTLGTISHEHNSPFILEFPIYGEHSCCKLWIFWQAIVISRFFKLQALFVKKILSCRCLEMLCGKDI
jgi:hypothetical protein